MSLQLLLLGHGMIYAAAVFLVHHRSFTPIMSKGRSTSTLPMATAKGSTHGRSFSRVAATLEVYVAHTRVWGGREGRREGGREGKGLLGLGVLFNCHA